MQITKEQKSDFYDMMRTYPDSGPEMVYMILTANGVKPVNAFQFVLSEALEIRVSQHADYHFKISGCGFSICFTDWSNITSVGRSYSVDVSVDDGIEVFTAVVFYGSDVSKELHDMTMANFDKFKKYLIYDM